MDIISYIHWSTKKIRNLEKQICCLSEQGGGGLTSVTTEDSDSIDFSGDGTPGNPLTATVIGGSGTQDLQSVTDIGNTTTNEILVQNAVLKNSIFGSGAVLAFGESAGDGTVVNPTSFHSVLIGNSAGYDSDLTRSTLVGGYAGYQNSGAGIIALGNNAGAGNSGSNLIAIGNTTSLINNTGDNVISIGENAVTANSGNNAIILGGLGTSNIYNDIIGLGYGTSPSNTNQFIIKPGSYQLVHNFINLTSDREQYVADDDGYSVISGSPYSAGLVNQVLAISPLGIPDWITATDIILDATPSIRGLMGIGVQTFGGNKTFNGFTILQGGFQTNTATNNSNLAVTTGSNLTPVTIPLEGSTTTQFKLATTGTTNQALSTGVSYATYLMGSVPITEFTSGTHPLVATVAIKPGALTDAGATTTNTASLYIEGPWTGVTPTGGAYTMWSKTGLNRFGGDINVDNTSTNGLSLFNTVDQITNYEVGRAYWVGNVFTIRTTAGGSGGTRSIRLQASSRSLTIDPANSTTGKFLFNHGGSDGQAGSRGLIASYNIGASSGSQIWMGAYGEVTQTGTAGYTGLFISPLETTTGSGIKNLIDVGTNSNGTGSGTHTSKFFASSSGQVGVNVASGANAATAALQVDSTTQGFLPPRMTEAQKNAIVSPAEGLIIYQTDATKGWYGYDGTAWVSLN